MSSQYNEYSTLKVVGMRRIQEAFVHYVKIEGEWKDLKFKSAPNWDEAVYEHRALVDILRSEGVMVQSLSPHENLTLDSVYTRDATIVTPKGLVICNMGKVSRSAEPKINAKNYMEIGFSVLGEIETPGTVEGGDFVWFNEHNAAVGLGPRTNEEGIRQLKILLGEDINLHIVPLSKPDHKKHFFHLISIISPLDNNLALIYKPLINNNFLSFLHNLKIELIEVDDKEHLDMGCNVLAIGPRKIIMLAGLPNTRQKLINKNCKVFVYKGDEISRKGGGGPICLTRPLERE